MLGQSEPLIHALDSWHGLRWRVVRRDRQEQHNVMQLFCFTVSSSSNKPTMTKENFTKFLNEKQRDSRLNEELFPRLRQDQIKALIDKYEPCSSNSNRSEIQ